MGKATGLTGRQIFNIFSCHEASFYTSQHTVSIIVKASILYNNCCCWSSIIFSHRFLLDHIVIHHSQQWQNSNHGYHM